MHPEAHTFRLIATPWWVNLAILVPTLSFYSWGRKGLALEGRTLAAADAFGVAFGFAEAAAVDYLRATVGLPSSRAWAPPLEGVSQRLLEIEVLREAATIVMLVAVALLGARRARERWALFLYAFALWDLAYYAGLWATVRWPPSLSADDILFLIPVPWIANVWFPVLVSGLCVVAVVLGSYIRLRDGALAQTPPAEP